MDNVEIDDIVDSFNPSANNSFNTTNALAADVALDNVGNTDDSVDNSVDVDVDLDNVGNDNSVNDSGNDNSDNSDNSVNDSGNDNSTNADGSFNTDNSETDNSVNAGEREYNTGFGGYSGGGGGGGGGDVWINDADTVVDQSSNNNIQAVGFGGEGDEGGGNVGLVSTNLANVASGDGAVAVGGNLTTTTNIDESTNIGNGAEGDVQIGDNTYNTSIDNSFNYDETTNIAIDNSEDYSFDNVGNSYVDVEVNDSFNDLSATFNSADWELDANVIWNSDDSAIVDDVDVDF